MRRSFEAFARGDFEAAFSAYDPGVEWRTAADEPDHRTHRGLAEVRALVGSLAEPWTNRFGGAMTFEGFIDRGDVVVVPWSAGRPTSSACGERRSCASRSTGAPSRR